MNRGINDLISSLLFSFKTSLRLLYQILHIRNNLQLCIRDIENGNVQTS